MMLVNHKDDTKLKPARFNLGGLIKKKMTWKRSIDQLAATLDHVLVLNLDTEPLTLENYTYSIPAHRTLDRHASFTTECILLLNSDMTLHMEEEDQLALPPKPQVEQTPVPPEVLVHQTEPISPAVDSAEEPASNYRAGGYHPVKIGDRYSSASTQYVVCRKLGWGHFSTVWLCRDTCTRAHVAMKIVKLGPNYAEAARDEVGILRWLQDDDDGDCGVGGDNAANKGNGLSPIVRLLDEFEVRGPNGVHVAMVFELMGENMLHLIYKCKALRALRSAKMLPLDVVRLIARQILQLVDYMHRRGVVHTDLKPENVLMGWCGKVPDFGAIAPQPFHIVPSQPLVCNRPLFGIEVKIADLGNATYTGMHFTNHIQTRQYRSPEIILKHINWGALADVWSIGCLIFELMTGDYLFDPHDGLTFSKDEDHLAQMIEVIGKFPHEEYLEQCELGSTYFYGPRAMANIPTMKFWLLKNVLAEKYGYDTSDPAVRLAIDVMLKCLVFDPSDRYDCGSLLEHPWFTSGVYDEVELAHLPNRNSEIRGFTCEE